MYELKVVSHFSAAHRLKDFEGNCERLHGHNWKVEVYVTSSSLNKVGLVLDFGIIKQKTQEVLKELDHQYLNELPAFAHQNPSSENIAQFIFDKLNKSLDTPNVHISKVAVWESENACAAYSK
ncbi:MAG TPA: 6-carboxytetrahydropterin synthase QueD [Syntrophaceae bacterium]|nr:6-carboxytetrahydropterin synthase QueD [Syntrophaceae bacterium]